VKRVEAEQKLMEELLEVRCALLAALRLKGVMSYFQRRERAYTEYTHECESKYEQEIPRASSGALADVTSTVRGAGASFLSTLSSLGFSSRAPAERKTDTSSSTT
jgi:hypothetical protein